MPSKSTAKKSPYSLHPSFAMEESSLVNLKERTGKSLEQWVAIVKKSAPKEAKERAAWLKSEHAFTTNYAMWVADRSCGIGGAENYDPDGLVEAMYTGKEALRPIHEALVKLGLSMG